MYSRVTTEFGAQRTAGHGENGESLLILIVNRAAREQPKVHYIGSCVRNSLGIGLDLKCSRLLVLLYVPN